MGEKILGHVGRKFRPLAHYFQFLPGHFLNGDRQYGVEVFDFRITLLGWQGGPSEIVIAQVEVRHFAADLDVDNLVIPNTNQKPGVF